MMPAAGYHHARKNPRARRSIRVSALLGVTMLALVAGIEHYRARDHLSYFCERKGELVSADVKLAHEDVDHALYDVTLRDDRGLSVRGALKVPHAGTAPRAAIVTLGGLRSGVHALEYVRDTGDFVVFAMDFPYDGKRSRLSAWEVMRWFPAMRRALLDTPPATMLGVDYLCARGDVDPGRIILLAGSLGALTAPATAAADERIAMLALLFGAGDLAALLEANLPGPAPLRRPVAWLLSAVVSPLEPLKYAGRVAPRPVFMLNGTDDPRMPEHCSRRLHEAAGEPKAIRWISAGHVSVRDAGFQAQVLDMFREWLAQAGYATST